MGERFRIRVSTTQEHSRTKGNFYAYFATHPYTAFASLSYLYQALISYNLITPRFVLRKYQISLLLHQVFNRASKFNALFDSNLFAIMSLCFLPPAEVKPES
jgi:hypothetical protein